jgi:predicted esterase
MNFRASHSPRAASRLLALAIAATTSRALASDPASLVRAYLDAPDDAGRRLVIDRVRESGASALDLAAAIRRGEDLDPVEPGVHRIEVVIQEDGSKSECLLSVPPDYHPGRAWPLLVSMHGTGGRGEDCLELWRELACDAGFLLACPTATTFREKGWGSSALERSQVLSVIARVSQICRVDSERVYLGGWSMGGHGTFDVAVHHPDRFAALNPAIGGLMLGYFGLAENLVPVPIFLVSGAQDQKELVDRQREAAALLKKKGAEFVHHEHADGGHEMYPEELPGVLAWLRGHARDPMPRTVHLLANDARYGRVAWLAIDALGKEARAPEAAVTLHAGGKLSDAETQRRYFVELEKTAARIEGKRVDATHLAVETRFVSSYSVLVLDGWLDLAKPISVTTNGRPSFSGKVTTDAAALLEDFRRTGDRSRLVLARIPVRIDAVPPR